MTKAKSGGGITSNKNVRPPVKTGSPRANKISPGAADRIGQQVVMTTSQGTKLVQGTAPQAPLGNALAQNVGKGGPGTGRTVHKAGSQSATPSVSPITSPQGWPWKGN